MNADLVYIPNDGTEFVSLSSEPMAFSRSVKGKLFKKHILSTGPLFYPGIKGGKVDIDSAFLNKVVENFENKVRPIVQVPMVDANNQHSEDPRANIGEVVGLAVEGNKLYSIIDARDEDAAKKVGKTLIGASALLSLDCTDNRTGLKAGPTLVHVAITNNPHVNELDEFEELLAASSSDSNTKAVILSATQTEEKVPMDLDEFITKGREEFSIDIPALQRAAAESDQFAKLSSVLQDKLVESEVLKLSNAESPSAEDIVVAVTNVLETNVALSSKVDALVEDNAKTKAEARIDSLVADGFITPAKRDSQLKLLLSNQELFEELLPEQPLVALSQEEGRDILDEAPEKVVTDEIARLSADAATQGISIKS